MTELEEALLALR